MTTRFSSLAGLLLLGACAAQSAQPLPAAPSAAAVTPASAPSSAADTAQTTPWYVEQTTCAEILAASDDDRATAGMFYYGYLAAKNRIRSLDVSQIGPNLRKVMTTCSADPKLTMPAAFSRALSTTGR